MEDARSEFGQAGVGRSSCLHYDRLMAFVLVPSRSCIASRDPYCGWVAEGACRKVVGNIKWVMWLHKRRSTFPQWRLEGFHLAAAHSHERFKVFSHPRACVTFIFCCDNVRWRAVWIPSSLEKLKQTQLRFEKFASTGCWRPPEVNTARHNFRVTFVRISHPVWRPRWNFYICHASDLSNFMVCKCNSPQPKKSNWDNKWKKSCSRPGVGCVGQGKHDDCYNYKLWL